MNDLSSRCQSCGMPLDHGFYGTNTDGTENREWCFVCFKKGAFVEPELTQEQMIKKSVGHMMRVLRFTPDDANRRARDVIPHLARWKT